MSIKLTEHQIQGQMVAYCKSQGILAFQTDVMSGLQYFSHKDPRRFAFIKHHEKMGYIKGQPDLVLVLDRGVVFVEVKTPQLYRMGKRGKLIQDGKGGTQSDEQKAFQKTVQAMGHEYHLCDNLNDFMGICNPRIEIEIKESK